MCQAEMEWGRELKKEGWSEGRAEGQAETAQLAKLMNLLADAGRIDDIKKAAKDLSYRNMLLKEFNLDK